MEKPAVFEIKKSFVEEFEDYVIGKYKENIRPCGGEVNPHYCTCENCETDALVDWDAENGMWLCESCFGGPL